MTAESYYDRWVREAKARISRRLAELRKAREARGSDDATDSGRTGREPGEEAAR